MWHYEPLGVARSRSRPSRGRPSASARELGRARAEHARVAEADDMCIGCNASPSTQYYNGNFTAFLPRPDTVAGLLTLRHSILTFICHSGNLDEMLLGNVDQRCGRTCSASAPVAFSHNCRSSRESSRGCVLSPWSIEATGRLGDWATETALQFCMLLRIHWT